MDNKIINQAEYSDTPLAKKLSIKPAFKVCLINPPEYYPDLFDDMPADVLFAGPSSKENDLIHFFSKEAEEYTRLLPVLKDRIIQNGMIWVSWPKKASKIVTDVTEDLVRNFAISIGLVDIKICAIDETWSGLKLVIPVKDRK